jgi:hypothetical protein
MTPDRHNAIQNYYLRPDPPLFSLPSTFKLQSAYILLANIVFGLRYDVTQKFLAVDAVNNKLEHFKPMWSYAKQNGFEVPYFSKKN